MDRLIPAAIIGALLAAGCAGCSAGAGTSEVGEQDWQRLPDAPLGPRDDAVLVGVGDRVLVVGGWEFSCPPNADCSEPDDPLFADGAVYDAAGDSWHPVTPPPFGVREEDDATAGLDGTAYLLTGCATGPGCDAPQRLLSYRLDDDRWTDHGPVPGGPVTLRHLTALDRSLLVHSDSDQQGEAADLIFDPADSSWAELPADPLPPLRERFLVPVGEQLVLTGATLDSGGGRMAAARFDPAARQWSPLPDAPGPGHQLLPTDRGPLLSGDLPDSAGWLLDAGSWTWSELPGPSPEHGAVHGVLDRDRAVYELPIGLSWLSAAAPVRIYDSAANALVPVPAPPGSEDVYGDSGTALGRDLFVFGGQRTGRDDSAAGGAWLWTAPAA